MSQNHYHYRYDDYNPFSPILVLRVFVTIKETPCGYWIKELGPNSDHKQRWVSKTSHRRYAYPTILEAWSSYRHRKYKQQAHLRCYLERSNCIIEYLERQSLTPPAVLSPANDPEGERYVTMGTVDREFILQTLSKEIPNG